jgi:hypothetical protein
VLQDVKERMMVTDVQRRTLFDALVNQLGEGPAETMMELLPPVDWADMARRSDVAELRSDLVSGMRAMDGRLTGEIGGLRGEMGELRGGMRAMDGRLTGEIGGLRGEMGELRGGMRAMDGRLTGEIGGLRGEMGELRGEIGELRGEMRALGSRVEAQFAKLVVANLLTSGALVGLVLGAVRLAGG